MTNEQREAIDRLQELVNLRKRKNNIKHDTCICGTEDLDTVLSLIKEQQEEIEGLKNKEVLIKRYFKKCDLIKQKDKQIDLMAEEIANNITNVCPREDYNYDLDCENRCSDNYKECWKLYFAELASRSDGRATDS